MDFVKHKRSFFIIHTTNTQHIYIYTGIIVYIVSNPTCFDVFASSSGSFILLLR